jgi:hypothetical protein
MFEVLAERYFRVIHVFRTRPEAETWLKLQRQAAAAGGGSISDGMEA